MWGRLPILPQTLLLITVSLLASALVNIALIWALPVPRLDFFALHDIADTVAAVRADPATRPRDPALTVTIAADPPAPNDDLVTHPSLTHALAQRVGLAERDVRLVYRADQSNFPFRYRTDDAGVPLRNGEAQFYNTVYAAARRDDGRWVVVKTPDRPLITRFQQRSIWSFLLSVMVALPVGFLFARQLTAPIRRFAEAAGRVGADNAAPAVPVAGPSEIRQAAEALTKMQARITEQLAERAAMIGAIAHDLRTPLTRIAFRIESAPEPMRRAVLADIEQMRAMVEASIGFIRHGSEIGELEPLDLAAIARRVAGDSRDMGHAVAVAIDEVWVTGDALALERLVQNLVDNAVAYAGAAELSVRREGLDAVLVVADRGPGLDPQMIEEVFRPFRRGEPSRNRGTGGVGLGLAIARLIAVAHGGSLVARARVGGGLELVARFPALQASEQGKRSAA